MNNLPARNINNQLIPNQYAVRMKDRSVVFLPENIGKDIQIKFQSGALKTFTYGASRSGSQVDFIGTLEDYYKQYPDEEPKNTGQPGLSWDEIKKLPGQGYDGIITRAVRLRKAERFLRGLKTSKINAKGISTPQIDSLIAKTVGQMLELSTN